MPDQSPSMQECACDDLFHPRCIGADGLPVDERVPEFGLERIRVKARSADPESVWIVRLPALVKVKKVQPICLAVDDVDMDFVS